MLLGGHTAQQAIQRMANKFVATKMATYKKRSKDIIFLDDFLDHLENKPQDVVFLIHWGPDVAQLLKRLKGFPIVYVAHSTNWKFSVPKNTPIIAVSRHSQAYWGKHAPYNPIYYLPNIIDAQFKNTTADREIDVLIMKRKNSRYVLNELAPLLKQHCRVKVVDGWIDDIAKEMRKSRVFIYDSSEYYQSKNVSEGFGLPPLEAMACGCHVFSSLNDALSDFLEPGVNCHQIRAGCSDFDLQAILSTLRSEGHFGDAEKTVLPWREPNVCIKTERIVISINHFFDGLSMVAKPRSALSKIISHFLTRDTQPNHPPQLPSKDKSTTENDLYSFTYSDYDKHSYDCNTPVRTKAVIH